MKVGLIGLPEVGKTTLFNALTRRQEALHTYHARDDEAHLGSVTVPDERFTFAVNVCQPKKQVPATLEITDGGARIEVEHARERFGTDFFAGVRNMDALVLVLRAFSSETLPDPPNGIDPARDARLVMEELLLADMAVIDGRLERLEKARQQKRQSPAEAAEHQVLLRVRQHLDQLRPVRELDLSHEEERTIRSFAFLTAKPLILVANINESEIGPDPPSTRELRALARDAGLELIELCAQVEMECSQMAAEEEREFLRELGVEEPARDRLIRAAYRALGYISFFTAGSDEVRAWTVRAGTTAVGCAERIHTDLARTFIRAEVMDFEDFRAAGGWEQAKAAGRMRLEGKDYVVRDGEIVHIRNSKG